MRYEAIGGRSYDPWPGSKSSTGLAFGKLIELSTLGLSRFF